jgi:hypothetical protein
MSVFIIFRCNIHIHTYTQEFLKDLHSILLTLMLNSSKWMQSILHFCDPKYERTRKSLLLILGCQSDSHHYWQKLNVSLLKSTYLFSTICLMVFLYLSRAILMSSTCQLLVHLLLPGQKSHRPFDCSSFFPPHLPLSRKVKVELREFPISDKKYSALIRQRKNGPML